MMICRFVLLLLALCTISALAHTEECNHSNIRYSLCSSIDNQLKQVSNFFTETEFLQECHEHFTELIVNKSCQHHHDESPSSTSTMIDQKPTFKQRFFYGLIAVFVVSALSIVGLLALPILYKVSFEHVLNLFTAIAIGTLFGDAIFHLMPIVVGLHQHENKEHGHHHHEEQSASLLSNQWKMLLAVSVLYAFFLLEVFLHWFAHYKHDHKSGDCPDHHQSQIISSYDHQSMKNGEIRQYSRVNIDPDIEHSHLHHNYTHHNLHQHLSIDTRTPSICSNGKSYHHTNSLPCTPRTNGNEFHITNNPFVFPPIERTFADKGEQASISSRVFVKHVNTSVRSLESVISSKKKIKTTGWMVLFGDSIHNFADGLAISAAFSQSSALGITTTIAIACHELPHELGDYAVLLRSGFSHYRALLWNFLSATTAILGFFVGSFVPDTENARQWMFAATIGMFLYIALVDLLPNLLSDGQFEWRSFLIINIGLIAGAAVMFLLALYEDSIQNISWR